MVRQTFFTLTLLAGAGVVGQGAFGQDPASQSLAAAAKAAAADFQPGAAQRQAQAKAQLAAAMADLDRFLQTGAPPKAAGWKRYLQWNDLVATLQSDQPAPPALTQTLLDKLAAAHAGLELPPFVRLREAIAQYASAAASGDDTQAKEQYTKTMNELAAALEAYERDPAAGDAALTIGRAVGWLAQHGQAAPLVAQIRQRYGQSNFFGSASRRFLAAGIEEPVDRVTGVRDNILGTDIYGTARMTGATTLVLNEHPTAASMSVVLSGMVSSNNVGYNGPVTIYSTGLTSVRGNKPLLMTADGLFGYPAGASCATSTNIYDICARCGLIERIAWRRADEQQHEAEAIASQHAASRVAGQMNGEAARMIAEQNQRYVDKFRNPLVRRGEFPEEFLFSSTAERAALRMTQHASGLLAAPGAPPEGDAASDLSVRAHESVVTNFGQGLLGGYELTDLRLEALLRDDLETDVPDELRVTLPDGKLDPEKEPWSIIFAKDLPVRARFQQGGLWMAIRADGFTRGEGDTPGKYRPAVTELVEIAAAYKIEKTDRGATLRRDGDVQIRFPNRANPEQITIRDNAIVTFIRRKFRSLFKEEFVGEGITFKGRWARAGRLQLQEIRSNNAWLALGWQMAQTAAPVAAAEPSAEPAAGGGGE